MSNYDKILREKESSLPISREEKELNWETLNKKLNPNSKIESHNKKFKLDAPSVLSVIHQLSSIF